MVATLQKETGAEPGQQIAPVIEKSLQAEASSAHSRINIPLNLENWKALSEEVSGELLWFHQHLLDDHIPWDAACEALGYDRSTIFKVLKGNYEGSWSNIVAAIRSYRKLLDQRGSIRKNEFAENSVSKLIFAALDYALANNSITIVIGESRMGKTIAGHEWANRNNHGRSVFVTAPVLGGAKALSRRIATHCGVGKGKNMGELIESIYRAFNGNRILIVDEAHRLLPSDNRTVNPACLELLRDLHDMTGCGLALFSTQRLPNGLEKGAYQYEQLVGRIGMPVRLPAKIKRPDLLPIVRQFIPRPSVTLLDEMDRIANQPGRLGIMTETLKVASRIATKAKETLGEEHVRKAVALRVQMSGGGADK